MPGRTVKGKKVNLPDTLLIPKGRLYRCSNLISYTFRYLDIVKKGELCIPKGSKRYRKGIFIHVGEEAAATIGIGIDLETTIIKELRREENLISNSK